VAEVAEVVAAESEERFPDGVIGDDELDAAALRGDSKRQAEGSVERDALIAELKRATGLGAAELAAHLDGSIVTGVSCCYEPRADIAWTT